MNKLLKIALAVALVMGGLFGLDKASAAICLVQNGCTGTGQIPTNGQVLIGNASGTYTPGTIAGGSSTIIMAGNQFLLVNQTGVNATLTPISVLSLTSSSDISVSNATGTNIFFTFLNPKNFTTTTIQSVLNSLSATGLATYNSSTGVFNVSSSSLNLSQYLTTASATATYYPITNPTGFTTTTIQAVLNALSATGLATYNSSTGVFSVSSSTLNLGTASQYNKSDVLPSSTIYVSTFNTRSGAVTLSSGDVTTALGFTPYNATNPSGYISNITGLINSTGTNITVSGLGTIASPFIINASGGTGFSTTTPYVNGNLTLASGTALSTFGGSTTSGSGNCLTGVTVSASGTLSNTNTACSGGSGLTGNGTSTWIPIYNASQTLQGYANLTFTSSTNTLAVGGAVSFPLTNASGTEIYTLQNDTSGFLEINETGTTPGNGSPQPYNIILQNITATSSASNAESTISQSVNFSDGSRTFTDWTTEQYPPTFLTGFFETATGASGSSSQLYPFGLTFTPQGGGHHTVFQVTPLNVTGTWNGATFTLTGNTSIVGAASTTGNFAVGASETIASGLTIAGGGANIVGNIVATGTLNLSNAGNGSINTFRGSTGNFDTQCLGTGSTAWWCEQLNPDGTNNFTIVDSQNGGAVLTANTNGTTTIGNSGTGNTIVLGTTTTSIFIPNVTSSLDLSNSEGKITAFGGATCGLGQGIKNLSASGTATCATFLTSGVTSFNGSTNTVNYNVLGTGNVTTSVATSGGNTTTTVSITGVIPSANGGTATTTALGTCAFLSTCGGTGSGNLFVTPTSSVLANNVVAFQSSASSTVKATSSIYALNNGDVTLGSSSDNGLFSVVNASGTPVVKVSSTTNPTSSAVLLDLQATSSVFQILASGHINATGTAPSMGTCGTSPSVVGNDAAGTITIGSGVVTSCTLNFAIPYESSNISVLESDNSTAVTGDVTSITTSSVTFGFSATLGGGKLYYMVAENL